jgi:hypothetical protein
MKVMAEWLDMSRRVMAKEVEMRGRVMHRVDRVQGFFSSRPNWDPLPPPPQASVPPLGTHSLAEEGVGGFQFGRGDRHCGTLGIYVLCGVWTGWCKEDECHWQRSEGTAEGKRMRALRLMKVK